MSREVLLTEWIPSTMAEFLEEETLENKLHIASWGRLHMGRTSYLLWFTRFCLEQCYSHFSDLDFECRPYLDSKPEFVHRGIITSKFNPRCLLRNLINVMNGMYW